MIGASSLLMYAAMYLNTYAFDHIFFSEMRLYMNLLMTAIMAVVMLWFMRHMYTNKRTNESIHYWRQYCIVCHGSILGP